MHVKCYDKNIGFCYKIISINLNYLIKQKKLCLFEDYFKNTNKSENDLSQRKKKQVRATVLYIRIVK